MKDHHRHSSRGEQPDLQTAYMKDSNETSSQVSSKSAAQLDMGFSPWQRLKSKRISYLTLPLLAMATVVEFVILATGWKYQQAVCLPQGMGVTFFGIGPIGATILAVELLKLPLAVWTASRAGWQKGFMLVVGLPLICVLTFQLVKDMGVYEMSTAMGPASQLLEKASAEETKINHLNGELAAIEEKKADRERKLAELTAKKAKARAELEESIKRNQDARQDAISLTDYQKKELSEVEARQANIIKQFDADTAQLTKAIADLRARRETEVPRAAKWNAEEARIDNAYKAKLAAYTNKKAAYEKDKKEYESANVLKRQLMREPVDPGVPPERESNTILKPMLVAEIDDQIKAKEDELAAVNNKRRERVAQVDADARRVREEFDRRSSAKREESDRKREELSAALAALATEGKAEEKLIDQELAAAVKNVDGIRAEMDACRKKAEGYYEAREAAIKNTQVHRIATTVEIVRGLLFGERPMSIKATAKERGDILTDQISMVRIWVYPVLAFIVAFLPTLMVELGFSTLFHREEQRPPYRLGFFGRRLHSLYIRAGRHKILRAERLAREVSAQVAARDEALAAAIAERDAALATVKANAEQAQIEKAAEAQAARAALEAAAAEHEQQLKKKEEEWVAKFGGLADSLSRAVAEKDALRDFQKAEIERQVQLRQNAWSDRLTQLTQELDAQRATSEAERATMVQEHHKKLLEVSEDSKAQVLQARRQASNAELAAQEAMAKLKYELKEALNARDMAVSQLQQQTAALSLKLTQAKEEAAREMEKAARQEKHRFERQQSEFVNTLRQRDEELDHQLKQREQELALEFETRLVEEKTRVDEEARHREAELQRQLEVRVQEVDARWKQEVKQREDAVQTRIKQREQQLQLQAAQELRRRESEFDRQLETQSREADARLKQELQQKELEFQAKLKQREQDLTTRAAARETELQNQWAADSRVREEEWTRQTEARVRATEIRLGQEARQREEILEIKIRQREQQLQSEFDARQAEMQGQTEQFRRRRDLESADATQRALRDQEAQLRQEMQQKVEAAQARAKQREQELLAQLNAQSQANQLAVQEAKAELETMRRNIEPFNALLARTEKERDEARRTASEGVRHVQDLEKKLMEASSLLTGWKNGKTAVTTRVGRDVLQVVPIGSVGSEDV